MQKRLTSVSGVIVLAILAAGCADSTDPHKPTKLGITLSQLSTTAGASIAIQVTVQDVSGGTVGSAAPITLAFGANPGGSGTTLLGDVTADAVSGVAMFSDVHITKAAQGYTLVASSPGLESATT